MPANLKAEAAKVATARRMLDEVQQALVKDGLLTPDSERTFNAARSCATDVETLLATLYGQREFQRP